MEVGVSTAGNQTHKNHLQFDEGYCDHRLMKAGCLAAAADYRLAWDDVGGGPFERGYVQ